MTLKEISSHFHIGMETLCFYQDNRLLTGKRGSSGEMEYQDEDIERAVQMHFLLKAGMDLESVKRFAALCEEGTHTRAAQIRILRKYRYQLLEEIHQKQQMLDRLDYLIREIHCRQEKGDIFGEGS